MTETRRAWATRPALAVLSGILLVLSFPDADVGVLAWVGLAPLLIACEGRSLPRVYLLAYVTGLIYFATTFYWIWIVAAYNVVDFAGLAAYLPQYFTAWAVAVFWIRRRTGLPLAAIAPPLWVTLEYIRSHLGWASLPWMLLGHTQYAYPTLTQVAAITGVYGLTFLIVLVSAAIADTVSSSGWLETRTLDWAAWRRKSAIPLALTALALIAVSVYGTVELHRVAERGELRVALVQGNIPQPWKWDDANRRTIIARYAGLSRAAAAERPTLIVWPETAVPGDVHHHPELRRAVSEIATDTGSYLLVGSGEFAKFTNGALREKLYNSMFLFSPSGTIDGQYRKMRLLPFGEYEPSGGVVRWPESIVAASSMGGFVPGDQYTTFRIGDATLGALICWETIFPDLAREFVARGARVLVNATNEAWFKQTAAPYQLLAMTTFRAVENRVSIVRVANTGVTAVIDPFGRITSRLQAPDRRELFVEGVLVKTVPLGTGSTFYTHYGDAFAFVQMIVAGVLMVAAGFVRIVAAAAPAGSLRHDQGMTSA